MGAVPEAEGLGSRGVDGEGTGASDGDGESDEGSRERLHGGERRGGRRACLLGGRDKGDGAEVACQRWRGL